MTSPETDAFLIEGGNYSYAGLADFARRLERQRDALADALRTIRDSTHKNAVTLRGIADYALAELEAKP